MASHLVIITGIWLGAISEVYRDFILDHSTRIPVITVAEQLVALVEWRWYVRGNHSEVLKLRNPQVAVVSERIVLEGDVPSPLNPPSGCRFHTRCLFCIDVCIADEPVLTDVGNNH